MPLGSVEWPCRPPTLSRLAPTHLLPHLRPHLSLAPPRALPHLPAQSPKSVTLALSAQLVRYKSGFFRCQIAPALIRSAPAHAVTDRDGQTGVYMLSLFLLESFC